MENEDDESENIDYDTAEKGDEDDDGEPFKILCAKEVQLMEKTSPNAGYEVCSHVLRLQCVTCVLWALRRMSFWCSQYI